MRRRGPCFYRCRRRGIENKSHERALRSETALLIRFHVARHFNLFDSSRAA